MFIREVKLFKEIPSHVIDEIANMATEEVYPSGHVILKRGEYADFLYIIEEGFIELVIQGEEEIVFPLYQPGLVFGWSALVEPNRYTATAQCVKDSKVIKLDGDRLMRIFEEHPAEGMRVMKRLAGVIASRLERIYEKVTKDIAWDSAKVA